MKTSGFVVKAVDSEPESDEFTVELWEDGEHLDSWETDSGCSDTAIETMVSRWIQEFEVPPEQDDELVEQIKQMRDERSSG